MLNSDAVLAEKERKRFADSWPIRERCSLGFFCISAFLGRGLIRWCLSLVHILNKPKWVAVSSKVRFNSFHIFGKASSSWHPLCRHPLYRNYDILFSRNATFGNIVWYPYVTPSSLTKQLQACPTFSRFERMFLARIACLRLTGTPLCTSVCLTDSLVFMNLFLYVVQPNFTPTNFNLFKNISHVLTGRQNEW